MDARHKARLLVLISLVVGAFFVGLGAVFAGLSGALLGAMMGTVILGVTTSLLVPATRGGDGDEPNGCVAAWAVAALAVVLAGALLVGPNASAHTLTVWSEVTGHGITTGIRHLDGTEGGALVASADGDTLAVFTPANGWQNLDIAAGSNWQMACIYDDDGDGLHMVVASNAAGTAAIRKFVEGPAGTWTDSVIATTTLDTNNRDYGCMNEDLSTYWAGGVTAGLVNGSAGTRATEGITGIASGATNVAPACHDLRSQINGAGGSVDRWAPAKCIIHGSLGGGGDLITKNDNTTTETDRGTSSIVDARSVACQLTFDITGCWAAGNDFLARWDGAAIENVQLSSIEPWLSSSYLVRAMSGNADGVYAGAGTTNSVVLLHWTETDGWHVAANETDIGFAAADAIVSSYVSSNDRPVLYMVDTATGTDVKIFQAAAPGSAELVETFVCPVTCADVQVTFTAPEASAAILVRDIESTIYRFGLTLGGGVAEQTRQACSSVGAVNPLALLAFSVAPDDTWATLCDTISGDPVAVYGDAFGAMGIRRSHGIQLPATGADTRVQRIAHAGLGVAAVGGVETTSPEGRPLVLKPNTSNPVFCQQGNPSPGGSDTHFPAVDFGSGRVWFSLEDSSGGVVGQRVPPQRVGSSLFPEACNSRIQANWDASSITVCDGADVLLGIEAESLVRRFAVDFGTNSLNAIGEESTFLPADGALRCATDGQRYVAWSGGTVTVVDVDSMTRVLNVTMGGNIHGAQLSPSNNYLYATNGTQVNVWAVWQSTTSVAGDGGDSPNPDPGTHPFDPDATGLNPAEPGETSTGGQTPGEGGFVGGEPGSGAPLLGIDIETIAADKGVGREAIAWLMGIILTVGLMFGLFLAFKTPVALVIGAALGIGISTAFGLLPVWFIVILGVFALALVFFTRG